MFWAIYIIKRLKLTFYFARLDYRLVTFVELGLRVRLVDVIILSRYRNNQSNGIYRGGVSSTVSDVAFHVTFQFCRPKTNGSLFYNRVAKH